MRRTEPRHPRAVGPDDLHDALRFMRTVRQGMLCQHSGYYGNVVPDIEEEDTMHYN